MKIPPDILEKVAQRLMTGKEAAAEMGITYQYFCKLFQPFERIPAVTAAYKNKIKQLTATRKAFRKQLAEQVRSRKKTIKQAAKEANCAERTIYRYVNNEHL